MKLLFLLGASLLGLTACQKDDPAAHLAAAFNQRLTLRHGQSAVLANERAPELTVSFQKIGSDSRCPREVTCVWAGEVSVTLAVTDQSGASQPLTLRLLGLTSAADSAAVQLNNRQYTVVLYEVSPYPAPNAPQETGRKATLTIQRR